MKPLRVLSLGAGVQSSTVAMMMVHGEVELADVAIFADTCAEPKAVYQWLQWLTQRIGPRLEVVVVRQGAGLTANMEAGCSGARHCSNPPFFVSSGGLLKRNCTRDYKIAPILREVQRRRAGRSVVQVFGISTDEAQRRREPQRQYIAAHEYPLVDRGISRRDCLRWMIRHGYPTPPRSACVYCPYRCDAEWERMQALAPDDFAEACRVDAMVRRCLPGVRGLNGHQQRECFVHRSLKPLNEVDFRDDVGHGQGLLFQCADGMCGV